jgi:hypothetical protein
MAAANYTPIQLYYSTTASATPSSGNLTNGELAINITDGKLYYKDNGGVVQVIATKGAGTIGGSTTQIQYNNAGALAGNAAMTFNSGTNTTTLTTLNLTNALGATYGGTAQSAYTQGDVLYASAANTLSKLGIGTVNYILTSTGSVPQWVAPTSVTVQTANNLAGGAAGSVPYQSGVATTTFLAIGAANRVMTSSGTAPQWVTALTGLTGVSSSSITNTSLTSGRVVYSGASGVETDSASLTFNGTTLSAGGFSTTGLSTLVQTVTIGNSNFSGTAVFAAATPAKLYVGTGTVTDTTSAIGATNAVGAISSLAITPIAATNTSVTYTNASTLYIAGAPSAGTNITITNPYALYVAAGASYLPSLTLGAALPTGSGGTGLTSFTANGVVYASSASALATGSALTFDGTNLGVGTTAPSQKLTVSGGITVVGAATLSAAQGPLLFSFESPVSRIYMGDGTGYSLAFSKRGSSTTTDLMTLTDSGNLGIGTTSPGYKLEVRKDQNASTTIGVQNQNSGASGYSGIDFQSYGGGWQVGVPSSATFVNPLLFSFNGAEKMRLDSSGQLLIGGTSAISGSNLTIGNGSGSTGATQYFNAGTGGAALLGRISGSNTWLVGDTTSALGSGTGLINYVYGANPWIVYTNGSERARIDSAGNLGLGVAPSAWGSSYDTLQMLGGSIGAFTTTAITTFQNAYDSGAGSYVYLTSAAASRYTQGSGLHQWFNAPSGTAGNPITFTQAMTLTSSGNLLVGTTFDNGYKFATVVAPNASFQNAITMTNASDSDLSVRIRTNETSFINSGSAASFTFATNSTERARIDSSGNLNVGNTGSITDGGFVFSVGTTSIAYFGHGTGAASGSNFHVFGYNGSVIGSITQSGTTAVLYNVTSDQRLKENIVDAPEFGNVIDSIQVRSYDWKADGNHQRAGFIAQELVTVAPEAVHQPADPEQMMAVDYSKLVPMLVKEIQSLRKRLADAGIA